MVRVHDLALVVIAVDEDRRRRAAREIREVEAHLLARLVEHLLLEERQALLVVLDLGVVERGVGLPVEVREVGAHGRIERGASRDVELVPDAVMAEEVLLPQEILKPPLPAVIRVPDEDLELVAAVPRDDAALSGKRLELLRKRPEERVADCVPVAVIEGLEVVEVYCDDVGAFELPVMREALEDAVEAAAVEDAGKWIGVVRALEEPRGLGQHGDEDASRD